jgi:hypothetical protein
MHPGEIMRLQAWEDSPKLPKFKKYTSTPVGYDIISGQFRSNPFDLISRFEMGKDECAVALWNNAGMPNEDIWDDEVKHLNEVQNNLGELTDQTRALRCLIASLDIMHYRSMKAYEIILELIDEVQYKHIMPIGWYVPWWPPNQANRIELLEVYITFLKAWEQKQKSLTIRTDKQYKNELLRTIYAKLGDWSKVKSNYVLMIIEKLDSFMNLFHYPDPYYNSMELARFNMLAKNKMDMMIASVERESRISRNEDELIRRVEQYKHPIFYHGFFYEVDLWLDWIGKSKRVDFQKVSGKYDDEIISSTRDFLMALNSFLVNKAAGKEIKISGDVIDKLKSSFQNPTKEQLWLLSCLLKTIKQQLILYSDNTASELEKELEDDWLFDL